MGKTVPFFVAFAACALSCACAQNIKKPDWEFGKEAIRVHVRADHRLNIYNQKAHTLYLCFYQLSALNAFDQLAQDDEGIHKLLECRLFDPTVAAASSKTILSGENITIIFDRAERAKYFAIVTGYYAPLSNERMVRKHKIQVCKKRVSFFKRTYMCRPCPLTIELVLGPDQIEYSKLISRNEVCRDECE